MSERLIIQSPSLTGGVSRQAKHQRFPSQVQEAQNCVADPAAGLSKRPGTRLFREITSPAPDPASSLREHPIHRDQNEKYICVYGRDASSGDFILRVFEDDGTDGGDEATVTIDSDAEAYLDLNSAEASDFVFRTTADTTFIVNTTVVAQTNFTPDFTVAANFPTVERMKRDRGVHLSYYSVGNPATQWFQYRVDGKNVAKIQFGTISDFEWTNVAGNWDDPSTAGGAFESPFILGFVAKRADLSLTNAAWDDTAKTLTLAGAFASYTFIPGDRIRLTDGTSIPGAAQQVKDTYAEIVSRDSDDQITLGGFFYVTTGTNFTDGASISAGGNQTDWDAGGIYHYFQAQITDDAYDSVDDVMREWTESFRTTPHSSSSTYGNQDIGLYWTETAVNQGYATIVAPFRGSEADDIRVVKFTAGGDQAINQPTGPFFSEYVYLTAGTNNTTLTAGTGTVAAGEELISVDDRWVEVSEPGSADAGLNAGTLPVKMVRTTLDPLAFRVSLIDWDTREAGNSTNNPSPDLFTANTREGMITAISVANPGVVTSEAHGLQTGDVIQLIDTDSTPILDGERTVTRINDDTFSVGIQTTGAGTTGYWRQGGSKIGDIAVFQNRLVLVGGQFVAMSNAGDLFDFYAEDPNNATDADPIDRRVGGISVADLFAVVPFRSALVLFSTTGRQFELSSDGPATPSSVRVEASTAVQTTAVRPVVMGSYIYFVSGSGDRSAIHEYAFDDRILTSTTDIVTTHAAGFVPGGVTSISADSATRRIIVTKADTATIWVYTAYWSGNQKIQSAWTSWVFPDTYDIQDAVFLDDRVWILSESGGSFFLEWMPADPLGTPSGFPYEVYGDRQVTLTGSLNAGSTDFDLSAYLSSASASGINSLVRGNAFTGSAGTVSGGSFGYSGATVTVDTDESAGAVTLYRPFGVLVEFTRPFRRTDSGAVIGDRMTIRESQITATTTGPFKVTVIAPGFTTYELEYDAIDPPIDDHASVRISTAADADNIRMIATTNHPTPSTITGIEHLVEVSPAIRLRT